MLQTQFCELFEHLLEKNLMRWISNPEVVLKTIFSYFPRKSIEFLVLMLTYKLHVISYFLLASLHLNIYSYIQATKKIKLQKDVPLCTVYTSISPSEFKKEQIQKSSDSDMACWQREIASCLETNLLLGCCWWTLSHFVWKP